MVGISSPPEWLERLLGERFFNPCRVHEGVKKNEKNIFCLDCGVSICPHCMFPHRSHRLLQIRRYVYHDVIRVDDMEKLLDCSSVQSYITNSAKVVFLNQRPRTRAFRGSGNICWTCDRSLQDPYIYCSLACKVEHLGKKEGGLLRYLHDCECLPLPEMARGETCYFGFEDGQMTPDSVLEERACSASGSSASGVVGCRTLACTATTEVARKKRSSNIHNVFRVNCSTGTEMAVHPNRRKGVPNRSPLF